MPESLPHWWVCLLSSKQGRSDSHVTSHHVWLSRCNCANQELSRTKHWENSLRNSCYNPCCNPQKAKHLQCSLPARKVLATTPKTAMKALQKEDSAGSEGPSAVCVRQAASRRWINARSEVFCLLRRTTATAMSHRSEGWRTAPATLTSNPHQQPSWGGGKVGLEMS